MKRKFLPAYISFPAVQLNCCRLRCDSAIYGVVFRVKVGLFCVFIRNMSSSLTQEQKDKVRRRLFVEESPIETEISDGPLSTPLEDCNSSISQDISSQNKTNIIDLSNMTQQQKYEQMKKWNFDFDNEVPLNGNWEWERVEPPRNIDHKEKVCVLGKEEPGDRNV